jgi:hypothetical protein
VRERETERESEGNGKSKEETGNWKSLNWEGMKLETGK